MMTSTKPLNLFHDRRTLTGDHRARNRRNRAGKLINHGKQLQMM